MLSNLTRLQSRYSGQYPIPDDVPAFLDDVQPIIEVSEDGREYGLPNASALIDPVLRSWYGIVRRRHAECH